MQVENLLSMLDDCYTIQARYNQGDTKTYTYKVPKQLELEVGDKVIVNSPRNGFTVVTVAAIGNAEDMDLEAAFQYKWIAGRVDTEAYFAQVEADREKTAIVKELQRKAKLRAKIKELVGSLDDSEVPDFLAELMTKTK